MIPPARWKSPNPLNVPVASRTNDPLWRQFLPSLPGYLSVHNFQEDPGRDRLLVPDHALSMPALLANGVTLMQPTQANAQALGNSIWDAFQKLMTGGPVLHEAAPPKTHPPLPKEQRAGAAIGFRAWTVKLTLFGELPIDAALGAITANGQAFRPHWETRGPTHAKCEKHGDEDAPHYPGSCGLYVYHAMPARNWVPEAWQVFGAVRAWGKILVHDQGFRASVAEPIALAAVPGDGTLGWLNYELTRVTAQLMQVEMVPYQELRDVALQYGDPLEPGKFAAEQP